MDQVHRSRRRPYHRDGKKRPWNYQSTATLDATFRDHRAVAEFIDDADERPVTALEPERLVIRADVAARFEAS